MRLEQGERIGSHLRIERLLGCGAHGCAYVATHDYLGTQVLKLFGPTPEARICETLREAQVLAQLHHPNIVRVFDAGVAEFDGTLHPYLTMEYVEFDTLEPLIRERRPTPADAVRIVIQLLAGLGTAHGSNPPILHRDIIPSNVLVSSVNPFRVKLADFALARQVRPEVGMVGVEGVLDYLPPEAAHGYLTAESDLYAVGIVLFELLTGLPPFDNGPGPTLKDYLAPKWEPPRLPSSGARDIGPLLDSVVLKSVAPVREHRFVQASDFAAALQSVLDTEFS